MRIIDEREFSKFNLIHNLYHPSIYNMPTLSAAEHLAELQANKKHMEEQEAELGVAVEEEQRVAEAARKAEEEQMATEKKVAKSYPRSGRPWSPPLGRRRKGARL